MRSSFSSILSTVPFTLYPRHDRSIVRMKHLHCGVLALLELNGLTDDETLSETIANHNVYCHSDQFDSPEQARSFFRKFLQRLHT